MSNTDRHPECHMRTALGNCDPIGGFCTSVNESICEALHKVSRPQGEWIPCSERMPSNSDDVLITIKGNSFVASGTYAGYHSESEQWWYLGEDGEITDVPITADVIAWMPLPEPWEGADGE